MTKYYWGKGALYHANTRLKSLKIRKEYSVKELLEKAKEKRVYSMVVINAANSGYSGSTFSSWILQLPSIKYISGMMRLIPPGKARTKCSGWLDIKPRQPAWFLL